MSDQQGFRGFISKREDGDEFAVSLRGYMDRQIRVFAALDTNLDQINDSDHVEAAREVIGGTNFTVIVVGPERFGSVTSRRESYQMMEVKEAFRQHKERKASNNPHGIFIVHLIDDPTEEARDDLCEYLGQIKFGSRNFTHIYDAPYTVEKKSPAWTKAMRDISSAVRMFLDGINEDSKNPDEQAAVLRDEMPADLTPGEIAYIDRNIGNWLKGQTEDVRRTAGDSEEHAVRRALFDFDPDRGILLDGRESKSEEQRSKSTDDTETDPPHGNRQPVLTIIFQNQTEPLLIFGPAGAGKTTTLTTSAALMAARLGENFKGIARHLLATEIGSVVGSLPESSPRYIPVVLRCSTLAKKFETTPNPAPYKDFDRLLDLIIELVRSDCDTNSGSREEMRQRLSEQPFALFLDAVDEVLPEERARRIVDLIAYVNEQFRGADSHVKIVLSTRPKIVPPNKFIGIELTPLTLEQIDQYFAKFADSLAFATTEKKAVVEHAKELFSNKEQLEDFLSQPFNLNCFCYLAWQSLHSSGDKLLPNTETAFFGMIVRHLTKDATLDGPFQKPLPDGMFRAVLRRLAYDAISSEEGKDRLTIDAAKQLCRHTLATTYGYQSDDQRVQIPDTYPSKLLDYVAESTELLYKTNDHYVFNRVRFCEYLAGDRIDVDALTTTFLVGLDISKLQRFLPSISFCYALRLQRGIPEYAFNVVKGLVDRANDRIRDDTGEAFQWLNAALDCFNSGSKYDLMNNPRFHRGDEKGYEMLKDRASSMINAKRDLLSPQARSETIEKFLRLGRAAEPDQTIHQVRQLIRLLTGAMIKIDERWVPVEIPARELGVAPRDIMIERTPVLVCEFECFLKTQERKIEFWHHAPDERRICIDRVDGLVSEAGDVTPLESWRAQRRNPGNPVTFISWFEAVAYANWLTKKLTVDKELVGGEFLRLPTSREMELIARRFSDGKEYPWGDEPLPGKKSQVNWRRADIDGVSPPGTFPARHGIVDLGSNVRCWTIDEDSDGQPIWPPSEPTAEMQEAVGGSWADGLAELKIRRRPVGFSPSSRDARVGIRLIKDRYRS